MWFLLGLIIVSMIIYNVSAFVLDKFFNCDSDEVLNFVISIALVIIILLTCLIVDMANQKYEYYNTRDIVAMQDSQSYIVSRHDVESGMKYYYMYESGEDTYRTSQAPSNKSSIHISTGDYRIEIYKQQKKVKFFKFFLPSEYVDAYKYEFYIPKDSIVSDFKVDLK